MLSKKGSGKKPKKVGILTPCNHGIANSTLDLHEDQELHKLVPSLKKFQSTELAEDKNRLNINDEQVFEMLYQFIERIVEDNSFCQSLLESVEFEELSKGEIAETKSFKQKVQEAAQKAEQRRPRRLSKKISILLDLSEEESSSSGSFYSQNLFQTNNSVHQLGDVMLPCLNLSAKLIKDIFIAPSLFLMNLSLCLLLKYSYHTGTCLDRQNIGWILCISAILAYKIYYDEQIEDLFDCFQELMKTDKKIIADLERIFLEGLNYRAIISGPQYQYVVAKMLENQKENRCR